MDWVGTMDTLTVAYNGLVDFARRGGSEGTQIVPDLATSLPVITAGETRYAFQLRRGVRYSNGTLVKASDFLRAFERPFRGRSLAAQWFTSLVGADACKQRPRRCDLSQGVRTDDATGTIVFHLRRPDPDFLGSLIEWAPIPPGTPNHDLGTRPVPSTGPYMIESYVPKRTLTLVRNPYFHVWSSVASPDGFPDEIVLRLSDDPRAAVAAVERGQADLTPILAEHTRPEELEARYPSRVHLHPEHATVFLFLNTRLPPFDDVRVRRAVNLAVDRAAFARSEGGPQLAQVTCQLRPPGTVGFRRYCPYTADPDRTGEWKAPDLARARRLVAASGTKGMRVTVWTSPGLLDARRARGGLHSQEAGLPREPQGSSRRHRRVHSEDGRPEDPRGAGRNGGLLGLEHARIPSRYADVRLDPAREAEPESELLLRPEGGCPDRTGAEAAGHRSGCRGPGLDTDREPARRPRALGAALHAVVGRLRLQARRELPAPLPWRGGPPRPAVGPLKAIRRRPRRSDGC